MKSFLSLRFLRSSALSLFLVLAAIRPAHALPYYFEFGGTLASATDPSPLLQSQGKAASTTTTGSFGVPMTFGLQLQERSRGLLVAVALQHRFVSGTSGAGDSFTYMTTSPELRFEFWKLTLGVGYTNLVWDSLGFKRNADIASVITYEAQFLFPITVEIDFGLQASRQIFKTNTYGTGPNPATEYGAFFRLNFGFTEAGSTERRKYKGWRYPLGSPLN